MKRFFLLVAFISTAGIASAQSSQSATTAPQTMSAAEEERMTFASKATQLDASIQRNVPAVVSELMNGLMADMQKHITRSTHQLSIMNDANAKAELSKRVAAQSDIYSEIKAFSLNPNANRAAINAKLRDFVKLM